MESATEALTAIADNESPFVSRAMTPAPKLELKLWEQAGLDPEAGAGTTERPGHGRHASDREPARAYISDRGTYLSQTSNLELEVLVEGDPALLNVYHVMQVNPEQFDGVDAEGAQAFVEFMVSDQTQEMIRSFGVQEFGQPLFVPDAGKSEAELGLHRGLPQMTQRHRFQAGSLVRAI
jgi:tungstate transport system substrate-binding protein